MAQPNIPKKSEEGRARLRSKRVVRHHGDHKRQYIKRPKNVTVKPVDPVDPVAEAALVEGDEVLEDLELLQYDEEVNMAELQLAAAELGMELGVFPEVDAE